MTLSDLLVALVAFAAGFVLAVGLPNRFVPKRPKPPDTTLAAAVFLVRAGLLL